MGGWQNHLQEAGRPAELGKAADSQCMLPVHVAADRSQASSLFVPDSSLFMDVNMSVICVIPARLQSSRLPGKLLLQVAGRSLIQYAWEAATACPEFDEVIVATDSEEIAAAVRQFGGRAELTGAHSSGTDRIAEVVRRCCPDADVIVNLQGDEPELRGEVVAALVEQMRGSQAEMATVAAPIRTAQAVRDPACVKVILDDNGNAIYFSRAAIPACRDQTIEEVLESAEQSPWLMHIGLYAFRRDFLLRLTELPMSSLEQLEKLEQLRALQSGARIAVAVVQHSAAGIDTPEDFAAFEQRILTKQTKRAA